jgi:L-rhamnose mutarotase
MLVFTKVNVGLNDGIFHYKLKVTVFTGCDSTGNKNAGPLTKAQTAQRFGMVTGLKADKMAYYKKLHAAVWPAVQKK